MAILRSKEIIKMTDKEIQEKSKELKSELIKAKASGKKDGKSDVREIKRTIAKLMTFLRQKAIKSSEAKK